MPRLASGVLMLLLLAACRDPESVRVKTVYFDSGECTLAADWYLPGRANGVGLVFLHGSSTSGRHLHLYGELGRALAMRGYTILNLDLRGYGDADDPPRFDDPAAYDFVGDATRAASYVRHQRYGKKIPTWLLAGHSKGGGVALRAGLESADIQGVVSISPGRRIRQRFFDPADPGQLKYLQRRKTKDMELPVPIPLELLDSILDSYDIDRFRGQTLEKPVLYIEGSREPDDDLAFSQDWVASLRGPVTHVLIPRADHYFGTAIIKTETGKAYQTTSQEVFDSLAIAIDGWIKDNFPVKE